MKKLIRKFNSYLLQLLFRQLKSILRRQTFCRLYFFYIIMDINAITVIIIIIFLVLL